MSKSATTIDCGAYVQSAAELSPGQKIFIFGVMCLGYFIALLDIQIVSSSLQNIGGGLSAGKDEITWVQTSYLIAEIIVIPLTGFLSRVLSTRWLFSISAAGFTVTSLMCGMAWDIHSMIVFRALQGFLGGAMIPTVFTTAFMLFPGTKVVLPAAICGAIASLAPTLGPTIGGWITDTYSWHWLFYVNLVPGVFVAVVVPMLLKIDKPDFSLLKQADYLGILLMTLFLGCLQYVLEEGARWEWLADENILACAWISGVSGILFVWRSLTYAHPIVDLRALKDRNFSLGCLFSFVAGIGIFTTIYLTPLFLGRVEGYSAMQIGAAIFSTGVFQLLAIPFYAVLAKRVDLRWLMMFGLGLFALSMWLYTPITHEWGWRELLLPQALRGFSQQFAVAPAVILTLRTLPPMRLKLASGLFNLMRNLGGAIGIAICSSLLINRTNLHFLRLAEHLNAANPNVMEFKARTSLYAANMLGGDMAHGQVVALRELWKLTYREAQVQTYSDCFLVVGACFAVAALLVPLMRKAASRQGPPGPSPDAH